MSQHFHQLFEYQDCLNSLSSDLKFDPDQGLYMQILSVIRQLRMLPDHVGLQCPRVLEDLVWGDGAAQPSPFISVTSEHVGMQ